MSEDHYFQEELDEVIGEDEGNVNNVELGLENSPSFGLRRGRGADHAHGGLDYSSGHDSPIGLNM